ncbi:MAG: hypothetical protein J6C05_11560 [Prevotella sp.]|nr:hypothetical protein [Prevotella sp.]
MKVQAECNEALLLIAEAPPFFAKFSAMKVQAECNEALLLIAEAPPFFADLSAKVVKKNEIIKSSQGL